MKTHTALALSPGHAAAVGRFVRDSRFTERGAVITDLDGTAIAEYEGRIAIARRVEFALKALRDASCPVVLNTMRFPLSVMRTFGREWLKITGAPIPTVTLNGSEIGYVREEHGELVFDEIAAFPLSGREIDEVLRGVRGMLADGVDDLLVFHYPRDWREGERIWTPVASRVAAVAAKYRSAAHVDADGIDVLTERLHAQDIAMVFLLIDVPEDRLMAYQHTRRSNFITRRGVDKRFGAEAAARHLGFALADSVGAGDAELDTFLDAVGLALHVGRNDLPFKGVCDTLEIDDPDTLGDVLFALADLRRQAGREA